MVIYIYIHEFFISSILIPAGMTYVFTKKPVTHVVWGKVYNFFHKKSWTNTSQVHQPLRTEEKCGPGHSDRADVGGSHLVTVFFLLIAGEGFFGIWLCWGCPSRWIFCWNARTLAALPSELRSKTRDLAKMFWKVWFFRFQPIWDGHIGWSAETSHKKTYNLHKPSKVWSQCWERTTANVCCGGLALAGGYDERLPENVEHAAELQVRGSRRCMVQRGGTPRYL